MSIVSCFSVTSTASPIPSDQSVPPNKNPLKPVVGSVSYGGASTGTGSRLRKYWGGEGEDPLTSDDFIWNKDFVGRFRRMIQDPRPASLESSSPEQEESAGFLSLNRVMSLDSLEVDLSKDLGPISKIELDQLIRPPSEVNRSGSASPKWRLAPTRREQEKWDRASKAATGGTEEMFRELRRPRGDPKVLASQSREEYMKLKRKLQILTLSIGGIGLVSAYVSYTPETAASFGVGLLGSLIYVRMLGKSIDSMADGAKGLIKGSIGQPRLLVPVALVMIFNRWNEILVPEFGYMHLELIPMLVGFFTYKIATFIQAIEVAISPAR
ncbi:protein CONSERVED ONLY IN THE GREEN LINEAGE 160, chloroplastic-like isoform X4 [Syzygium oleosum]|uniref:protein CONSERVED ONLY IN THE GREEN LINEAGE 160, chloroplastic-like isoform X4 n=1 Tax=Syzygium oleosum TaxID=219896 RepID=UPI0024B99CC8|nr:protein CONSERVED ONLY IN THE GREEN LINEAGE 160, chloroplastic-like isoform X4 [Syzygium oleosum]